MKSARVRTGSIKLVFLILSAIAAIAAAGMWIMFESNSGVGVFGILSIAFFFVFLYSWYLETSG